MPNDLAARSLSADDGISRADYFDAGLTQPIPDGGHASPDGGQITNHFVLAGVERRHDRSEREAVVHERVRGRRRARDPAEDHARRALHVPEHRRVSSRTWRTRRWSRTTSACPALSSVEYILTNPSSSTPVLSIGGVPRRVSFDDPVHRYQAVEFTLEPALGDNWSALASYRWSRLRGNFEGFYRDDNGQSDPGITSLYDFPTNDPSYTAIGVPQFGYRGDIRFLGDRTASCRSIGRTRSSCSATTLPDRA